MLRNFVVLLICVGCSVRAKTLPEVDDERSGRWFGYRYTVTVTQQEEVTSLIPSSCVHVEPSLPACRSVRTLDTFPRFVGSQKYNGRQLSAAQQPPTPPPPIIHTTVLGWGEYLGLYAATVTVSTLKQVVTTVLDPRVVVTFSVKGCKPSRLPLDLMECSVAEGHNNLVVEPTASQPQLVTTTVRPIDTNSLSETNADLVEPTNSMTMEPSEGNLNMNAAANFVPTAPLK